MGKVGAGFSMSLDGFIALPNDEVGPLFNWYFSGNKDLPLPTGSGELPFKLSQESYDFFTKAVSATGAIVSGRRLFDVANAWGGMHPINVPIFVVTHTIPQEWNREGTPFTFCSDVESAVAQAKQVAGEKNVGVGGANIAQQCLKAGLLDEIHIDLVPVLLGKGIRFFECLGIEPIEMEITEVINAPGVTHLTYSVKK